MVTFRSRAGAALNGSLRVEWHEDGHFSQRGKTLIEFHLAGFEQTVGTEHHICNFTDVQPGGKHTARTTPSDEFLWLRRGDIERHEFHDPARRAERGIDPALETDRARIAFDDAGHAYARAADEFDHRGGGAHLDDFADDSAGENHRRIHGDPEILSLADDQLLPPLGKIP